MSPFVPFIFYLTVFLFAAVSVSVGVWTLVAISLERYFAICRPLKSRRWQTQFHAYKMIAVVWLASLFWSGPVLVVSSLRAMKRGKHNPQAIGHFSPTLSSEKNSTGLYIHAKKFHTITN